MADVIDKHRKVKIVKTPPKSVDTTDWKRKYENERKDRIATEKELEAAKVQIQRLKDTVLRLKGAQVAIEQAAMAFASVEKKQMAA